MKREGALQTLVELKRSSAFAVYGAVTSWPAWDMYCSRAREQLLFGQRRRSTELGCSEAASLSTQDKITGGCGS